MTTIRATTAPRLPAGRRLPAVLVALAALVALATAGCAASPPADRGGGASGEEPLALVYDGPQGCPDCAPAIAAVLRSGPHPYRVEYVGPGTDRRVDAATLAGARLYVQPGGGADLQATWRDLAGSAEALRSWVRAGGSYLGLCFGGYLAGHDPGFALLPGDTLGYTATPDATVTDDRDTVVEVSWRGRPRHLYFQDGPAFAVRGDADVVATYPNGAAAVVVARYGEGRVGVSGPHPEADASWFEQQGLPVPDDAGPDLVRDLVDATTARP